ncbi:MAG: 6-bladed beta-propeller [Candidatus Thiodiazotropha sp. (ex Monitilora ramsayi)]|nr:6-bladed beta-propeller [Candidatus Thiodiazotropha sp. (ex Monitilora ramsayi)]
MTRYLGMLIGLLLVACSTTGPETFDHSSDTSHLVWPPAPETSRIKFVTAFKTPEDLGLKKSIFRSFIDLFVGSEDRNLTRPYTLSVEQEMIAVADPDAAIVHLYDLHRKKYTKIEKAGETNLSSPIGVALGNNRLFIADSMLNKVFVLDSDMEIQLVLDDFMRPTSLAYDPDRDQLYVVDTLAHTIKIFDQQGNLVDTMGGRGEEDLQFNYPSHLAFADNKLIVNDTMNFRIQIFDQHGNHLDTFGKQGNASGYLTQSKGVAIDSDGHIYIADALANRIQIFDQAGQFLLEFGSVGSDPGTFRMPSGLAIQDDKIYIADSYNQRIQVFQYLKAGM